MEYWEKFKSKASKATADAKRQAEVQKIRVEINRARAKQKTLKQEFGIEVWDAMNAGNQAEVTRIFNEYSMKVQEIEIGVSSLKDRKTSLRGQAGSTSTLPTPTSAESPQANSYAAPAP